MKLTRKQKWRLARARKTKERHLLKLARSNKQGDYYNRLERHFKMKPVSNDDFKYHLTDTHRFKRSKGTITQISRL